MSRDSTKTSDEALADLGQKIGIPTLAVQDFDLVFAAAHGVDRYCDQFEAIALTPQERLHFMQLIVASLDAALHDRVPGSDSTKLRVEQLLLRDLADYKSIIDYWAMTPEFYVSPMMNKLKKDPRYIYTGGEAPFE